MGPTILAVGAVALGVATIVWWGVPALFGGGAAAVQMMAAPGMGGALIARAAFEAAPKAYFAALKAGQLIVRGGYVFLP